MAKTRKGFWLEQKEAKIVKQLAVKLKESESCVVRRIINTNDKEMWAQILKIKKEHEQGHT